MKSESPKNGLPSAYVVRSTFVQLIRLATPFTPKPVSQRFSTTPTPKSSARPVPDVALSRVTSSGVGSSGLMVSRPVPSVSSRSARATSVMLEAAQIIVVRGDVNAVAIGGACRHREAAAIAAGYRHRHLPDRGAAKMHLSVRHVDIGGSAEHVDQLLIEVHVCLHGHARTGADVDALEGSSGFLLKLDRLAPVRCRETFRARLVRGRGTAVAIQVAAQLCVANVDDEAIQPGAAVQLAGRHRITSERVVERRGRILHRPNHVEVVLGGVEPVEVAKHLEQPERQNNRAIIASPPRSSVSRGSRRCRGAHRHLPGVERPVLRRRLSRNKRADEEPEDDSAYPQHSPQFSGESKARVIDPPGVHNDGGGPIDHFSGDEARGCRRSRRAFLASSMKVLLQIIEVAFLELLEIQQLVARVTDGPNQLIELDLDRLGVSVLRCFESGTPSETSR